MAVAPIPNTRVSNLLLRQRLTQQYQADQLDLFRLQEQISTGQRITLPSDDAPAALRSIALQRLIERKSQLETNIQGGQSFLSATDTAIAEVAKELADLKGATLGVAGTIATQQDRDAVISQVNRFLESLISTANRQFRGRYLFSGSQASEQPYSFDGNNVVYDGDDNSIRNYSDLGVLFASNATGQAVFGGISEAVTGTVDLNPQLEAETQLSSLRGGRGISPNGAIAISDGNNTSIIDLSNARTVGDVVRLIEENPPQGRSIEVAITGQGLTLALDTGSIFIGEVGNGTTARELGIAEVAGTAIKVSDDLDPILLKTTRLDDLLGTKARAVIESGAAKDNADVLIEASANGSALDGVTVQFVDDGLLRANSGLTAGNEVVEYDANARASFTALTFAGSGNDLIVTANTVGIANNNVRINITNGGAVGDVATASYNATTKILNIAVDNTGATTVQSVIDAIATTGEFTATADGSVEAALNPAATIASTDIGIVQGDTGNSGGEAKTLYIRIKPGDSDANQVVAAINTEGTFNASLDPSDSTSFFEAGTGKVNLNGASAVTAGGTGVSLDQASGIRVVNGGQTFDITFNGAETVEDLLNLLNSSEAGLLAEVNSKGTGINIRSRLSGNDFQIGEINGGQTATQLGIRTYTEDSKLSAFNFGVGIPTKNDESVAITSANLEITASDGQVFNVDLSAATTLTDAINTINLATTVNVTAQLDSEGSGIELIDNTAGFERLTVAQSGPDIPINGGIGFSLPSDDFAITSIDGQNFRIDVGSAKTVGDVLDAINTATGGAVTAQLADSGNGIELLDNTTGTGALAVTALSGSQAAEYLGLVKNGQTVNTSVTSTLTGADRNALETDSVFNTLIRLRDALQGNDINAIERALAKVDSDIGRVTFARAEVGARWQGLIQTEQSLQEEEIQLRSALSDEIDVDLVEAISQLTARQISLEASLRTSANILQLSLLNFL